MACGRLSSRIDFSSNAARLNALHWSDDGKLLLITNEALDVLDTRRERRQNRQYSITAAWIESTTKAWKPNIAESVSLNAKNPTVSSDAVRLHFNRGLVQLHCADSPCTLAFTTAAWSPLGCDRTGGCLLAGLRTDYWIAVYQAPIGLLKRWTEIADVSSHLLRFCRSNPTLWNAEETARERKLEISPALHEHRMDLLAGAALSWSKLLPGGKSLLLAVATRSGLVFFIKLGVPVLEKPEIDVLGFVDTKVKWPTCLTWLRKPGEDYHLAMGTTQGSVLLCTVRCSHGFSFSLRHIWPADGIPVHSIKWKNSVEPLADIDSRFLVVVKNAVVLFVSCKGEGGEKPRYRIVQGLHSSSVSGITETLSGIWFSTSVDGQLATFDFESPSPRYLDLKGTFGEIASAYHGCAVSPNGLFLFVVVCPNNTLLTSVKRVWSSKKSQVCAITLTPQVDISDQLKLLESPYLIWDVLDYLLLPDAASYRKRIVAQSQSTPNPCSLQLDELQTRRSLLNVVQSVTHPDSADQSRLEGARFRRSKRLLGRKWRLRLSQSGIATIRIDCLVVTTVQNWLRKQTRYDLLEEEREDNSAVVEFPVGKQDEVCCLSFLPLSKFKPYRFCSRSGSFALSFEDNDSAWLKDILSPVHRCPFCGCSFTEATRK